MLAQGLPVYGNFGSEDDFNFLTDRGISLHGCIVLLRLGKTSIIDQVCHVYRSTCDRFYRIQICTCLTLLLRCFSGFWSLEKRCWWRITIRWSAAISAIRLSFCSRRNISDTFDRVTKTTRCLYFFIILEKCLLLYRSKPCHLMGKSHILLLKFQKLWTAIQTVVLLFKLLKQWLLELYWGDELVPALYDTAIGISLLF